MSETEIVGPGVPVPDGASIDLGAHRTIWRSRRVRIGLTVGALFGLVALSVLGVVGCDPTTPPHPCDTTIGCGAWRHSSSAGSGPKVLIVGDSILAAYGLPSGVDDTNGAILASARVAQNGLSVRTYTSTGSMFEHWNTGRILSSNDPSRPITGDSIALLNVGQSPPTRHVVIALGTNDATRIYQGHRTQQQVADQVLASMNQALISSTNCTIMVLPAIHGFSVVNPYIADVRNVVRFVAGVKNAELGRTRVVVADFHQLWVANGRPQSWFQGTQDPHTSAAGYSRYLDLITLFTAFAKNGTLGC